MNYRTLFTWFILIIYCDAKEILSKEKIYSMVDISNPHYASAIIDKDIQKTQIAYAQGAFDMRVESKYDKKEYPTSNAMYQDIYLNKTFQSGIEVQSGYRKSDGIQEYNNIKTGNSGDIIAGIKLPVVEILKQTNEKKLNLNLAKLHLGSVGYEVEQKLREFYFTLFRRYYELLLENELFKLEEELFQKAKNRYDFISQRIKIGDMAQIVGLEAKQIIFDREQRLTQSQNNYNRAKENLLEFLNIDETLFRNYDLPSLFQDKVYSLPYEQIIIKIVENRPILKVLNINKDKLKEQKSFAEILKYPRIDASLHAIYDNQKDDSGFKMMLSFSLPIERSYYHANKLKIKLQQEKNDNEIEKTLLEAQKNASIISYSFEALQKNIDSVVQEIDLTKELQKAEERKFELGQSNLFMINQREMNKLTALQKQARYQTMLYITMLEYERESGEILNNIISAIKN